MTAEKRADAIKEWRHIVKEMMNTMRKAFNQEQKEKYLTSVMEQVSGCQSVCHQHTEADLVHYAGLFRQLHSGKAGYKFWNPAPRRSKSIALRL